MMSLAAGKLNGPACAIVNLAGSPEDIGLAQAEFILSNPTPSNVSSLVHWRTRDGGSGRALARWLSHWNPGLLSETEALARGLGGSPYSVLGSWTRQPRQEERSGCTLIGACTGSPPVVGRNFDLGFSRADIRVLKTEPRPGLTSIATGGWLGRYDGMNSSGLVIAMAVVESRDEPPPSPGAIPATLLIRTALDQLQTSDQVLNLIDLIPGWGPVNYLIAEPSGEMAVVEREAGALRVRTADKGLVVAANHFAGRQALRRASSERYEAASSKSAARLSTADRMKDLLFQLGNPRLTRWSEVFLPGERLVHFSGGHGAAYREFSLSRPTPDQTGSGRCRTGIGITHYPSLAHDPGFQQ